MLKPFKDINQDNWKLLLCRQDLSSNVCFMSVNNSSYCNPKESDQEGGIEFSSSSVVGRTVRKVNIKRLFKKNHI